MFAEVSQLVAPSVFALEAAATGLNASLTKLPYVAYTKSTSNGAGNHRIG